MESFRKVIEEITAVLEMLPNHSRYWAHIHPYRKPETLREHTLLVVDYACVLVRKHGLDEVIDRLVADVAGRSSGLGGDPKVVAWLKRLFAAVFVYHDLGKTNVNFQSARMSNSLFRADPTVGWKPASGHSLPGSYLFAVSYSDEILKKEDWPEEKRLGLVVMVFLFSYLIRRHHAGRLGCLTDTELQEDFVEYAGKLGDYLKLFGFAVDESRMGRVMENMKRIQSQFRDDGMFRFSLFALLKLNYSLLTASDYLATHEYAGGNPVTDFGVFDNRQRVLEIIGHFRNFGYNRMLYDAPDDFSFRFPAEKSGENLNRLRTEMAVEVLQRVRKYGDRHLFYMEAPTGGGKTNLSVIAALELLERDERLNKIFYVFPYTTLITQTCRVLRNALGLHPSELVELHSKAPLSSKSGDGKMKGGGVSEEEENDGLYGDKGKDYIDHLFALYPVTVLSHVHFFDILKAEDKETNYLLHRLANSVVVIDELQSYNPGIWDRMLYFINHYARFFNIRFILMSATLPKIGQLSLGGEGQEEVTALLPDAGRYFRNLNFSQRVKFRLDLFRKETDLKMLAAHLVGTSEEYIRTRSACGTVHTIIEFIFKKSAAEFLRILQEMDHPFDRVLILSGTVLEPRRREIISYIRNPEHRDQNILLITTQVVEAGVDIDMDLGYKNVSLIDSDEQLAGRVNRNARKESAEVYLFSLDDAGVLYGKDGRYKATREKIDRQAYEEILTTKDFSRLYNLVLEGIDVWNGTEMVRNLSSFVKEGVERLNYGQTDRDFEIISQRNVSVFVPLPIPVEVESAVSGCMEPLFAGNELELLRSCGIEPEDGKIGGAEVWRLYEELIASGSRTFDLAEKADFRILQGIMSKYTFSMMYGAADHRNLLCGLGEERHGYVYFSHWNSAGDNGMPYSYSDGLNHLAFKDICFI